MHTLLGVVVTVWKFGNFCKYCTRYAPDLIFSWLYCRLQLWYSVSSVCHL